MVANLVVNLVLAAATKMADDLTSPAIRIGDLIHERAKVAAERRLNAAAQIVNPALAVLLHAVVLLVVLLAATQTDTSRLCLQRMKRKD